MLNAGPRPQQAIDRRWRSEALDELRGWLLAWARRTVALTPRAGLKVLVRKSDHASGGLATAYRSWRLSEDLDARMTLATVRRYTCPTATWDDIAPFIRVLRAALGGDR